MDDNSYDGIIKSEGHSPEKKFGDDLNTAEAVAHEDHYLTAEEDNKMTSGEKQD